MNQMKKKRLRWLSIVLIVAITITSIPPSYSSAVTVDEIITDITEVLEEKISAEQEAFLEAKSDMFQVNSAGNWFQACSKANLYGDHLAWNTFHNAVQNDIVAKQPRILGKELYLTTSEGKPGRADIYMKRGKVRYLWEVKPWSYSSGKKMKNALAQLKSYVKGTPKGNYKFDYGFNSGYTIQKKVITVHQYLVTYEDAGNGLILYKFKRKPDTQPDDGAGSAAKGRSTTDEDAEDEVIELIEDDLAAMRENANSTVSTIETAAKMAVIILPVAKIMKAFYEKFAKDSSMAMEATIISSSMIAILTAFLANPTEAEAASVQSKSLEYLDLIEALYGTGFANALKRAINENDTDKLESLYDEMDRKGITDEMKSMAESGEREREKSPAVRYGRTVCTAW